MVPEIPSGEKQSVPSHVKSLSVFRSPPTPTESKPLTGGLPTLQWPVFITSLGNGDQTPGPQWEGTKIWMER